jgi:hypothetical protein
MSARAFAQENDAATIETKRILSILTHSFGKAVDRYYADSTSLRVFTRKSQAV